MSSHQRSLGKLAQRGVSLQISPLATSMRTFYHTGRRPYTAQSLGQLNQWSRQRQPDSFERSQMRNIAGVKKPLVNQMKGMSTSIASSKVDPYKIYDKTRLFSFSSSLNSRAQHQEQEEDEGEYSDQESMPPNSTASLSATQRRYNQAAGIGKGMAQQAARDISQSIQEELMVVDCETRDMLNCDPGRKRVRNYHDQMTNRQQNGPSDPMQGWKHPRSLKYLSNISASDKEISSSSNSSSGSSPEEQIDRQVRPRRRQMVMGHVSRNRDALTNAALASPQFSSEPSYEMYTSTAKEKFSEQRSEPRPQTGWHSPKRAVEENPEDQLMDVSLVRAVRPDVTVARGLQKFEEEPAESSSLYEQPKSERDFLKKAILGGSRDRRNSGQVRMDELRYDSAANAAQISASQQVINHKYSGFRSSAQGNQKQIVESVNPTPQLKTYRRAVSEPRDMRRRRGSARQSVERQPAPRFFGEHRRPDEDEDEDEPRDRANLYKSNWPSPNHSLLQMSSRSDSILESESKGRERNVMGEKRGPKKATSPEYPVGQNNDIGMPTEYRKQSAVQRLGNASSKHTSRAFNSY
ncbi:uncharacterized protein LOC108115286 [Drosophila eugracilis]|uniref:uncharacterized protein LOC108115286 n=1 Tax=Drosophila eugracilis TaxID=29029 RepID=UPI0007E82132|nr:uncharacterized protein LOC108115286 [Drosophila eugracilis]